MRASLKLKNKVTKTILLARSVPRQEDSYFGSLLEASNFYGTLSDRKKRR